MHFWSTKMEFKVHCLPAVHISHNCASINKLTPLTHPYTVMGGYSHFGGDNAMKRFAKFSVSRHISYYNSMSEITYKTQTPPSHKGKGLVTIM